MKRAEEYTDEAEKYVLHEFDKTSIMVEVHKAIKQAQIDAIEEAVKRCYDEFELFEVDGIAVDIDYNSSVKVAEQLRKEIE